jgi:PilZ domain-containing protein
MARFEQGDVAPRTQNRIPMAVAVQLSGNERAPGVETTFTENVSARGARVVTIRRWQTDDRVLMISLPGDFRARARVAYCQRVRGNGFAIGLEFLEPNGSWVVDASAVPERTLKG